MSDMKKAHNQAQEALRKMKEKQEVTEESQEYAKKLKEEHQEFVDRQERLKHKEQEKSPYAPPGSPYRAEDDGREHRRRKVRRADERPQGKRAGRPASTLKRYLRSLPFWTFVIPCLFVLLRYIHNRVDLISDTRKIETHLYPRYAPEADKDAAAEDETECLQETEEEAYEDVPNYTDSEEDIERAIAAQDAAIASEKGPHFASLEDSVRWALRETTFETSFLCNVSFLCPTCFKFEYDHNGYQDEYTQGYSMSDHIELKADETGLAYIDEFPMENASYHEELGRIAPAIIVNSRADGRLQYFMTKEVKDGMTYVCKKFLYYNPEVGGIEGVRKGELSLEYPSKYEPEMQRIVQTIFSSFPIYDD